MNRPKWFSRLILGCLSIGLAIAVTHFTRAEMPYVQTASPSYETPYGEADGETAETAPASQQVSFPSDYAQNFVQYATVDCPNSRIVRKMFVNPEALSALQSSDMPSSGTVLVMETHSAQPGSDGRLTPTRLNNVFVREKRDDWQVNEDSGDWRSAWYSPSGDLVSNSQESCIGCHTMVRDSHPERQRQRDYTFTLPALLAAAQTGQLQHQETEFGTSVCR
ncbi:MAG: cytochrome P460 family protein [Cyanobacteria bacterium J06626_18]